VSRASVVRRCCAVLLTVGLLAVAVQVERVHRDTWEWTLRPSAAAPLLAFGGRDYKRTAPDLAVEPGFERIGTSRGGGAIFGPPLPHELTPVYLQVRDGEVVHGYVLMGGL
jgi:hypothetical protein